MSKTLILVVKIIFFISLHTKAQHFPSMRWQSRVLVIHLVDDQIPEPILDSLARAQPALNERKLRVFIRTKDTVFTYSSTIQTADPQQVDQVMAVKSNPEYIYLFGLDGGLKWTDTLPLQLNHVFEQIDAMPIRKREIKNGGNF